MQVRYQAALRPENIIIHERFNASLLQCMGVVYLGVAVVRVEHSGDV